MTGAMVMDPVVVAARAVASFVEEGGDHDAVVRAIGQLAVDAFGGAMAGVTWAPPDGAFATIGATDPLVAELDAVQCRSGSGPCLDAIRRVQPQILEDASRSAAWPELASAAAARGIRSVVSLPVRVAGRSTAAFTVYGRQAGLAGAADLELGAALAAQTAVATALAWSLDEAANLRTAIESRGVIDQAKGIVIASTGCDPEEAFQVLRAQSQHENRKLREVAAALVAQQRRNGR